MVTSSRLTALKRNARKEGWLKYIRGENDERALLKGHRVNLQRGHHVCEFFPKFLRHSKGRFAGKSFDLLDWQTDELLIPLFGWELQDEFGDWVRRFTKSYVELPKKMGKSTLSSGIGIYMLVGDGEQGAEIYSAATDRQQASIVHGEAITMVENSPELSDALYINRSTKTITYGDAQSCYRALSATPRSNEGWNAHCIIADELHKWFGDELYNALRWAFAARTQPLFFQVTTAGDDPQSVCRQQHDHAQGVIDGTITDERFFGLIKAADEEDDLWDEATWHKANPSLGVTVSLRSFRDDANEAQKSPATINAFKRYRLNIWTTGESPWLKVSDWKNCQLEFAPEDLAGEPCWAGLDLAKTRDTTSLQLVFPSEDGKFRILSYFWLPEATAIEQNHLVSWQAWADEEELFLTPGNVCDYHFVKRKIAELAEQFDIREIAFDPYNAEHLTQEVEEELGIPRIAFGQTIVNFAEPTSEFERLVICGDIEHAGQSVMDWQVGNVKIRTDANGNQRPLKPSPNDYRKVDGPVAAVMALARALQGESHHSAYDEDESERVVFI